MGRLLLVIVECLSIKMILNPLNIGQKSIQKFAAQNVLIALLKNQIVNKGLNRPLLKNNILCYQSNF